MKAPILISINFEFQTWVINALVISCAEIDAKHNPLQHFCVEHKLLSRCWEWESRNQGLVLFIYWNDGDVIKDSSNEIHRAKQISQIEVIFSDDAIRTNWAERHKHSLSLIVLLYWTELRWICYISGSEFFNFFIYISSLREFPLFCPALFTLE